MKEIIVTIGQDAVVRIETKGFKGTECLKETMALEKALGVTTHDTKTREFLQENKETHRATQS